MLNDIIKYHHHTEKSDNLVTPLLINEQLYIY